MREHNIRKIGRVHGQATTLGNSGQHVTTFA
jgi:hypothetical protein